MVGIVHVSQLGFFFFQAEDGIRDLVRSRGLGDVYKRQEVYRELRKISPHVILIAHGAALENPVDAQYILNLSLIHI